MDEAELDAIVTERDESGLPTLAFLPNAMQTDPDLFKEVGRWCCCVFVHSSAVLVAHSSFLLKASQQIGSSTATLINLVLIWCG